MKQSLHLAQIKNILRSTLFKLQPYAILIFVVFVGVIYMYMIVKINTLSGVEPSETEVISQVKAAKTPRLDEKTVKKLESLKENSVSVESLFVEARNNPFQ